MFSSRHRFPRNQIFRKSIFFSNSSFDQARPNLSKYKSWKEISSQKNLFESTAKQVGIADLEDWYKFSVKKLFSVDRSFHSLLKNQYRGSLFLALSSIYPEHKWIPWRFKSVPRNFWLSRENHAWYLGDLAQQIDPDFDPSKASDQDLLKFWGNADLRKMKKMVSRGMLNLHQGSMIKALMV